MADYYPLLARALDAASEKTPEARGQVFERARKALVTQLSSLDPPLGSAEIEREKASLDSAITRAAEAYGPSVEPAATVPVSTAAPAVAGLTFVDVEAPNTAARPRVALDSPTIRRGGSRRRSVLLTLGLVAVIGPIALAAWLLRDGPGSPIPSGPPPAPAPVAQAERSDGKIAERVGGAPGGAARPVAQGSAQPTARPVPPVVPPPVVPPVVSVPVVPVPVVPPPLPPAASIPAPSVVPGTAANQPTLPAQAGAGGAPPPPQPEVAIAQRALMVEENPPDPQNPRITAGRIVWRLDALNPGQGQPLQTVVRAQIDIPEALALSVVIRRNLDATLPASHTIELAFTPSRADDPARTVRDVALPQPKVDEAVRGVPLVGLPVPVKANLFLIGLSDLRGDVERNTELLLRRNWIDLPVRFTSGQRAVLSFEKGLPGERVLAEAFRLWRDGQ